MQQPGNDGSHVQIAKEHNLLGRLRSLELLLMQITSNKLQEGQTPL